MAAEPADFAGHFCCAFDKLFVTGYRKFRFRFSRLNGGGSLYLNISSPQCAAGFAQEWGICGLGAGFIAFLFMCFPVNDTNPAFKCSAHDSIAGWKDRPQVFSILAIQTG